MRKEDVVVKWRAGLHARPASDIVKAANKFSSKIIFKKDDVEVDGKSVIGMMTLGATYESVLVMIIDGEDEDDAIVALIDIFKKDIVDDL